MGGGGDFLFKLLIGSSDQNAQLSLGPDTSTEHYRLAVVLLFFFFFFSEIQKWNWKTASSSPYFSTKKVLPLVKVKGRIVNPVASADHQKWI